LNTIKHCIDVGISVGGANVLFNLLEETEEDIYESVENLRFFRFMLNEKNRFVLTPIPLAVSCISKYYNSIQDKKQEYLPKINLYHKAFINTFDEDTQWDFFEFSLNSKDAKWDYFTDMHYHYTKNSYEYKLIYEKDAIIYQEFLNEELIVHVEFDKNELYIPILDCCYDKVISIRELNALLSKNNNLDCDMKNLKEKIDTLFNHGLLYRTCCYDEIVSIIKLL
jgi:hypothetical protein